MAVGAEYANKPGAFKNFTYTKYKMTNNGLPEATPTTKDIGEDDVMLQPSLEVDDLVLDDDEYPLGTDINDYIAMTWEMIEELSHFE
ncbi:hypothetical protein K443DRAFT_11076 [Laccaria amethystina LaAM-08-1]|uniref:Uncharacterized protein n=1 Tax=Laccaria amethystina LaAM-08-1 TaxID=1095629 RepID=A0A0C9WK53_9AGAR|nr:hypothetical protein K443DRAFT_11076 [Laccaria amethystina LaAM-08-1]